jgi:electron transfer flavoprotein beta subunit
MRVAVCCKGVPTDAVLESVDVSGGDIEFKSSELYVNEFDAYALEAGMMLKSKYAAETFALSLGPLRVQEVLYYAMAKGVDQVLRIDGKTNRPELIASGLVAALKEIAPQLVLVGVQSEDWMGGKVGIYLAQALTMGLAYAVVEICDLNDTHVRIQKEIGGGKKEEVRLKLPAVLCIQSGIQPLRYVSAMKRQKVRNTPIKLWGKLDMEEAKRSLSGMMAYEIKEVSLPSREGYAEIITGDRPEKAKKLLEIIEKAV